MFEVEARLIWATLEAKLIDEEGVDFCVPLPRCLLKTIECFKELANEVRFGLVFEARRHFHVDVFFQVTVEECCDHVYLVKLKVECCDDRQEYAKCCERYDRGICLAVIPLHAPDETPLRRFEALFLTLNTYLHGMTCIPGWYSTRANVSFSRIESSSRLIPGAQKSMLADDVASVYD
eukprot:IDg19696t1